jgi:Uncharacterized C-terminal domain of topoisomerase IA
MSHQFGVHEILDKADKIAERDARIHYLRHNAGKPVQIVLQYALHPEIEWLISPEFPPYHPNQVDEGRETMLLAEARRLYLFVKGGNDALSEAKRRVLLTQLLDMLWEPDIDLLRHAVQKRLPYKNLDYGLIKEAFPQLLPDVDATAINIINGTKEEEPKMAKAATKKPAAKKAAKAPAKKAAPKKKAAKKA